MANIKIRTKHNGPRPRPDDNAALEAFVADGDGFRAYVHSGVLDSIREHAKVAGRNETIGLLMGRICRDLKGGPYTLVMVAEGAKEGEYESTPSYVELSTEGQLSVRRRLEDTHPDREIVGWFHTHPSYSPHFSSVDTDQQRTWNDPDHIGIVYSGISPTEPFGVYRGPDAIRLRRRQAERHSRESESRSDLPNQNQTATRSELEPPGEDVMTSSHSRNRNLGTAILSGVVLVYIVLFGYLYWIGHRVSLIEARVTELSDFKAVGQSPNDAGKSLTTSEPEAQSDKVSQTATEKGSKIPLTEGPQLRSPANPLAAGATSPTKPPKDTKGDSRRTGQGNSGNGQANSPRNEQTRNVRKESQEERSPSKPPSADSKKETQPQPQDTKPKSDKPAPQVNL